MKHTPSEQRLVDLIRAADGSLCPGEGYVPGFEARRLLRRLERQGVVSIENTDDGPRYTLVSP